MEPTAIEKEFPILIRLNADTFDFTTANTRGDDIRFETITGEPLAYQIEAWDPVQGNASIWVRIPRITGNAQQEIKMRWGNPLALTQSDGEAVFDRSNGYASVWHMNAPVNDSVGTVASKDEGTSASAGVIGPARHLAEGQGVFGGDDIRDYPSGAGPMTTEAWIKPARPNVTAMAWGKEQRPGKVMMQVVSPPRVAIRCYFADVEGKSPMELNQWYQVVHTYQRNDSRVYVNGRLDGASKPLLDIPNVSSLWLGGWYGNYDFVGDLDEVRISRVVRSPEWIKLQYENQKPLQTLVGSLVQPGGRFSVSTSELVLPEGGSAKVSGEAGGALKVYWILLREGRPTVIATDRFHITFDAGRVTGDQSLVLQFKAVYPEGTKTRDIPITIKEQIPDPNFTMTAPSRWDGRRIVEVVPRFLSPPAPPAPGAGELTYKWAISGPAVGKEIVPGKLILQRAQNNGELKVSLTVDNGGQSVTHAINIQVKEPRVDPWIQSLPVEDEAPLDHQFYARDHRNEGTVYYRGVLDQPADSVFVRAYAGDTLHKTERHKLMAGRKYDFPIKLKPGLVKYRLEFGSVTAGRETVLRNAADIVCGDAYLIDGQSNAEATAFGDREYPFSSEWIRSFGSTDGDPELARRKIWGNATARSQGGILQIGYWGMELARRLVEDQHIPICIINGAVGGTRIDQHQRNPRDHTDVESIYGRLAWRVEQARLTHGIRAVLWHQGENDQGADGPTGGYGWETYRESFIDMAAAWKQDYPNLQHYYLFQIWPKSCAMGIQGSDNHLREVQRTLPGAFANMGIMSTLGVAPPGTCHYPPEGYADIARLICPLVERDNYGKAFRESVTPPNLKQACFSNARRDEIVLEFDQPVKWTPSLASEFYLDGEKGLVASGAAEGNRLKLQLKSTSRASKITYLDGDHWKPENILRGANGIAALTFCEVPLELRSPSR